MKIDEIVCSEKDQTKKNDDVVLHERIQTVSNEEVEFDYSVRDEKVIAAHLLDANSNKQPIKLENIPKNLATIRDRMFFGSFLKDSYAKTYANRDGIGVEVFHRLRGGMNNANHGTSNVEVEEVQKTQKRINEVFSKMDDASDDNAVVLMGRTGCGKSTIMNLLAGIQLQGVDDGCGNVRVLPMVNGVEGCLSKFKIGCDVLSQTSEPHKWIDGNGVAFWDCPGFNDNRGVEQEIVGAMCIQKILQSALPPNNEGESSAKIKTVFVVSDSCFATSARGLDLLELVRHIDCLFCGNVGTIKNAISLVVTGSDSARSLKHVIDTINALIVKRLDLGLTDTQVEILKALKEEDRIAFFRKPSLNSQIETETVKKEILNAIEKSTAASNIHSYVALSDNAVVIARRCYDALAIAAVEYVDNILKNMRVAVRETCPNQETINGWQQEIRNAKSREFTDGIEGLNKVMEIVKGIDVRCPDIIEKTDRVLNICAMITKEPFLGKKHTEDSEKGHSQGAEHVHIKELEPLKYLSQILLENAQINLQSDTQHSGVDFISFNSRVFDILNKISESFSELRLIVSNTTIRISVSDAKEQNRLLEAANKENARKLEEQREEAVKMKNELATSKAALAELQKQLSYQNECHKRCGKKKKFCSIM